MNIDVMDFYDFLCLLDIAIICDIQSKFVIDVLRIKSKRWFTHSEVVL